VRALKQLDTPFSRCSLGTNSTIRGWPVPLAARAISNHQADLGIKIERPVPANRNAAIGSEHANPGAPRQHR